MHPNRQVEGGRISASLRYTPDHPTRISIRAAHLTTAQQRRIRDAILAIRDELDDAQIDAEVNAETARVVDWPDEFEIEATPAVSDTSAGVAMSGQALDART